MPEYKVFWKMKGIDMYFSTRTVPSNREVQLLDEEGKIIHVFGYKGAHINLERFSKHLKRYSEPDFTEFFKKAENRGAQIIIGDADLEIEESAACVLQAIFGEQVKIKPYEKTRRVEVRIKLTDFGPRQPVYEEN